MSHAGVLSSPARLTCKSERGDYIQNATPSNPSSQNSPSKGIFFTAKHVSLRDLFSSAGNQRCLFGCISFETSSSLNHEDFQLWSVFNFRSFQKGCTDTTQQDNTLSSCLLSTYFHTVNMQTNRARQMGDRILGHWTNAIFICEILANQTEQWRCVI